MDKEWVAIACTCTPYTLLITPRVGVQTADFSNPRRWRRTKRALSILIERGESGGIDVRAVSSDADGVTTAAADAASPANGTGSSRGWGELGPYAGEAIDRWRTESNGGRPRARMGGPTRSEERRAVDSTKPEGGMTLAGKEGSLPSTG